MSKIVEKAGLMQGTRVGTPLYLSPELVKQQPYDYKVDVWATGCVLYHVAGLEPPFSGENLIVLGNNIVAHQPKPLPAVFSTRLHKFIEKLMSKRPLERPAARDIIKMIPEFVRKESGGAEAPAEDNTEAATASTTEGISQRPSTRAVQPQPISPFRPVPEPAAVVAQKPTVTAVAVRVVGPVLPRAEAQSSSPGFLIEKELARHIQVPRDIEKHRPREEEFRRADRVCATAEVAKERHVRPAPEHVQLLAPPPRFFLPSEERKDYVPEPQLQLQPQPEQRENVSVIRPVRAVILCQNLVRPETAGQRRRPTLALLRSVNVENVVGASGTKSQGVMRPNSATIASSRQMSRETVVSATKASNNEDPPRGLCCRPRSAMPLSKAILPSIFNGGRYE